MVSQKDVLAGALLILIGSGAATISLGYRLGSISRMGPGYFPLIVSVLIVLFGLVVVANAFWAGRRDKIEFDFGYLRKLAILLAAICAFAVTIRSLGAVIAISLLVSIGRLAGGVPSLREVISICIVMILICIVVFNYLLGMNLPLWWA